MRMFAHNQRLFRKKGQGGLTLVQSDQFSLPLSSCLIPPVLPSFLLFPLPPLSLQKLPGALHPGCIDGVKSMFWDPDNLILGLALP